MDEVTKAEIQRLHDEEHRQNQRIAKLEESLESIQTLTLSVQKLADNMERMCVEQNRQGERLEALEKEPVNEYREVKIAVITAVVTCVITAICTLFI